MPYVSDVTPLIRPVNRIAHITPPLGLYLARKQSLLPPERVNDCVSPDPLALYSVSCDAHTPTVYTLPYLSELTPYPISMPVPAICAAHNTDPLELYLVRKQSSDPAFVNIIFDNPFIVNKEDVANNVELLYDLT